MTMPIKLKWMKVESLLNLYFFHVRIRRYSLNWRCIVVAVQFNEFYFFFRITASLFVTIFSGLIEPHIASQSTFKSL